MQEKQQKGCSGCLGALGFILLIGIAAGAWFGYQEWRSGEDQVARADGRVLLFGDTYTANGISCSGAGEYQMIGRDTSIAIVANDDALLTTVLSAGMVLDNGACEFTFFGDVDVHDRYQVVIGEDLNTIEAACRPGSVPVTETSSGQTARFLIHIDAGGPACVQP